MEQLQFEFQGNANAKNTARDWVLVGVVSSGNLEVMVERTDLDGQCKVTVNTSINGYGAIWRAVLEDCFKRHRLRDVAISINDAGATPAVVSLRLDQAVEEFFAPAI